TEDWTGMTNPTERRKLQNRLNQRARRKSLLMPRKGLTSEQGSRAKQSPSKLERDTEKSGSKECITASPRAQALMQHFAEHAYTSYMQGTPALSHLPLLVKFNNAEILGVVAEFFEDDGLSPFTRPEKSNDAWPRSLHPTRLQSSIEHHPWVDAFPSPRLRDNLLQAFEHPDICDEDELCHDICEYDRVDSEHLMIVWGASWDPQSWEVTPEFLNKWGWLLSGCADVMKSTNTWRAKRG
ncbi:hypothetical protein CC80DRAFT_395852, partial [Byssothecium circinans]